MDKRCSVCGEVKALDAFYRAPGMRDGFRNDCKACNLAAKAARHATNPQPVRDRVRRWQRANPDRVREKQLQYRADGRKKAADRRSYLKRSFGITPEDYDAMLEKQGGACAVCGREPRTDISLHVDHCHDSGAIRGLLCFDCNAGIGKFRDDVELLRAAIDYLGDRRHPPSGAEPESR